MWSKSRNNHLKILSRNREIFSIFFVNMCYNNKNMQTNYKKLWKLLIDKEIKKSELIGKAGISANIVAKLSKGEPISMESLKKICIALECDVGDIVVLNDVNEINN